MLANDTDPESDPLTAVLASSPSHGTLTLDSDGSFTYQPNANYHGADSFTYKANDGELDSEAATVSITINSVNDAPTAADDNYSGTEDTLLEVAAPGVLENDTDVDGDPLSASVDDNATNGTLILNADGSFSYTPAENYCGEDSFTYEVADGSGGTASATVTLSIACVNDTPVATDDSLTTDEDIPNTVSVLDNDSDADNDTLGVSVTTGPAHGQAVVNPDGTVTYTPNPNYFGTDSFDYTIDDGYGGTATASVSVTVNPVNDAPTATADNALVTVDEGGTAGNTGTFADIDSTSLALSASTGSVTDNGSGTWSWSLGTGDGNGAVQQVTITVEDDGAAQGTVTFDLVVNNVAPTAQDGNETTDEDTPMQLTLSATDPGSDLDAAGYAVVSGPSHGTLSGSGGTLTYTPNKDYFGPDALTFTAKDLDGATSNEATFNLTINPVNDAPVASGESYDATEDVVLNVDAPGVLGNDSDVEGDTLTAVPGANPSHGSLTLNGSGSFAYTPAENYCGDDSFSYTAFDGELSSEAVTVNLTVACVNDVPTLNVANASVSVDEGSAASNTGNFDDPDLPYGDSVSLSASTGSVVDNGDGTWTWTPDTTADDHGPETVTITATDNATATATSSFTFTVNNVAPTVDAGPNATIDEGGTFAGSGSFTDPGADTWTATVDYGDGSQALTLDGKTFALSHLYPQDGSYTVTVTVSDDDGGTHSDSLDVTVNNVAPTVTFTPSNGTVDEGGQLSFDISASDPADTLSLNSASCGSNATVDAQSFDSSTNTGSLTCTFHDGPSTETVSVTIADDDTSTTESASVTVTNVAPTITELSVTPELVSLDNPDYGETALNLSFTDPAESYDSYTADVNWGDGTSSLGQTVYGNSSNSLPHTYGAAGVYTVSVTVEDDDGGSANQTYSQYVVVYDPDGGFVTGGGWIDSPGQACKDTDICVDATGKANFGFVSKYKKGATVPTGNTVFQFKAGDLDFRSDTQEWLVVNQGGTNAQFKGSGTINGQNDTNGNPYKFIIWAGDDNPDTFRIRIWSEEGGGEYDVYDNGFEQTIGGGSIVIHTR